MELRKNDIYDLPVKERRIEGDSLCYIVELAGKEYGVRLFKFQKNDPLPERLSCLVKDIDERGPMLVQNYGPLLTRFYKEEGVYTFWVRRDLSDATVGCYEVGDNNGFYFRVQTPKGIKLRVSQKVKCKVALLKDGRLNLKLAESEICNKDNYPFRPLEEMVEAIDMPKADIRWVTRIVRNTPAFVGVREALSEFDEGWARTGIELLAESLDRWIVAAGRRRKRILDICGKVCLHFLEDSDYLSEGDDEQRRAFVQLLSQTMERIEGYLEAERLLEADGHGGYVDDLLAKMKKSGNLYHSESRLQVMFYVFCLERSCLDQKIRSFLEVVVEGPAFLCLSAPYRDVFIRILELYIGGHVDYIDRMGQIENEEEAVRVRNVVMSLAALLLLSQGEEQTKWRLVRARLYRYLTFLKASSSSLLLEKAFGVIASMGYPKLEFERKDLKELTMLIIRLCYPWMDSPEMRPEWCYENRQVRLRIQDGAIGLQSVKKGKKQSLCLPEGLLPWHQLQVQLSTADIGKPALANKDLASWQKLWRDVEQWLFDGTGVPSLKSCRRKVTPEIGDQVRIRIVRREPRNPNYFLCRIEDDMYQGEGMLCTYNIVRYNLYVDESAFMSESGKPYLLQAVVQSRRKDGGFNFRFVELLDTFVYQRVYVGEIVTCVVSEVQKFHYFCISNDGYGLFISRMTEVPVLGPGDFLEAEVNEVRSTGAIKADFLKQVAPAFTVGDAFANLIYSYADEQVYDEEEEAETLVDECESDRMEEEAACELMHVIDRVSMLEDNYMKAYNYLGFARTMAVLLNKDEYKKSYEERMKLLQLLQQFAINGQMDMKELRVRSDSCHDLLPRYPLLQSNLLDMLVLGSLDTSAQNNFLWKVMQQGGNERRTKLAKLVLAYNLLESPSMHRQQDAICAEIYDMLNMDVGKYTLYSFGNEGQKVEFKTSIVYAPGKGMKADLPKQTQEIMSVICGFLNADGGTLYLGVNDEGVASGLDNDIAYFNGSLDKFDLHVRNSVVRYMGMEANAKMSVSYLTAGKRQVYVLDIQPCPHPVMCDGVYYQRQGSSTWALQGDALKSFLESRQEPDAPLPQAKCDEEVKLPAEAGSQVVDSSEEQSVVQSDKSAMKQVSGDGEMFTSQIRANATHSWMDGFGVSAVRYLHLLSENGYLITEDECWRNDVALSLVIHEDEADGYLVNVFESGRIVKVAITDLLDKKLDKEYKRYGQEKLVFSCPVHKDDALLTVMSDVQQRPAYRMDDIANLKEGNMLAKGDFVSTVETAGVLHCEVIPASKKASLKRIHNMKSTLIGLNLTVYWGGEELRLLEEMGVRVK